MDYNNCVNCRSSCIPKVEKSCIVYVISITCKEVNVYKLYKDTPVQLFYSNKLSKEELITCPANILFDSCNNLYIANNKYPYSIIKLDTHKNETHLSMPDPTSIISGMSIDCDDNIYITDICNSKVYKHTSNPNLNANVLTVITDKIINPTSVIYDKVNKLLYVSTKDTVYKLDQQYAIIETIKVNLLKCTNIIGLAINSKQDIFALDKNNAVYRINLSLCNDSYANLFAQNGHLNCPDYIVIDGYDNIYISNQKCNNIIKIDPRSFQSIYEYDIENPHGIITKL